MPNDQETLNQEQKQDEGGNNANNDENVKDEQTQEQTQNNDINTIKQELLEYIDEKNKALMNMILSSEKNKKDENKEDEENDEFVETF